jgi:uncharacterized protein YbcI
MTEKKRTYESKINQVTDQLEESTIGQGKPNEKVLFFADPLFLFLITTADHFEHYLLPSNTQSKRQKKSQRAKLPKHLNNRLISKDVLYSIEGNKLVTL